MARYADEELLPSWLATRLGTGALAALLVLAGIGLFQNAARSQPDPWTSDSGTARVTYADPAVPEAVAAPPEELVAATFLVVGPADPAPAPTSQAPVRRPQPRQMAVLDTSSSAEPVVVQAPAAAPLAPELPAVPASEPDPQAPSVSA